MNVIKLLYVIGIIFFLLPIIGITLITLSLSSITELSVSLNGVFNLLLGNWYWFLVGFINLLFGYYGKSNQKVERFGKYIVVISVALLIIFFVFVPISFPSPITSILK